MFCDEAVVTVKAGDGGSGTVSFRREKSVAKGGPNGGDGGKGGNVLLRSSFSTHTLSNYRIDKIWEAEKGYSGEKKDMHGKNGKDLVLIVPVGTVVYDEETNEVLVDMDKEGVGFLLETGGRGGYGNAHFVSSVRQSPRFAEKGETVFKHTYRFELKLVADVAIIGFPSVGKSTLISVISNCRPKIADYPFTTLVPNLGVVKVGEEDFIVADIPGLIEGASIGKGLGDSFLRHVERCGILIHMLDINDSEFLKHFDIINTELALYSPVLSQKQQIVVFNKIDSTDEEYVNLAQQEFHKKYPDIEIYSISSVTHKGIEKLLYVVKDKVVEWRKTHGEEIKTDEQRESERVVMRPHLTQDEMYWSCEKDKKRYIVHSNRIEQIANMTDTKNIEALSRLYDVLEKRSITKELRSLGWEPSEALWIGRWKIRFIQI